jgi:serine/threonine protein kinase/Tol biopolymer transport system component
MTPERWRQIEDLCHAALALGPNERGAFLDHTCAGDDALRREVESLIAQESGAEGFMSVPAAAMASTITDRPKGARVGQRLGVYPIRSLLGVGGMGEVYRAYDETLGREVAIKVLPPQFTADAHRNARFEREARLLATLNHPHIGAIYGVQDVDGVRALVLELVEGETLADRIARSGSAPMPIAEALGVAGQITDALEAAHEKGIVHRDLKPANIKITPDGVVKVLDFGLAKAPDTESARTDVTASRDGAILGTAAYMSPEQARSQALDKRTDIWAFGCVLYEMLTGCLAFPGDTLSDTIAAILQSEPDWSALPATTPPSVRRLLLRCLEKNVKRRLRDIGDVRIDLDAVDAPLPGIPEEPTPTRARTRIGWLPWFAVVALISGIGIREAARPVVSVDPLADAEFRRLTDWEGTEEGAEISPDGKFVAFLADRSGEFDIWVSQVGSRNFKNLTENIPALAPSGFIVRKLGFSADGTDIWFNPGDSQPLLLMPTTGGEPRSFLGEGANVPAWSPDGAHVAFVYKRNRDDPMYVVDRSFGDRRQILPPGPNKVNNLVWSPDGQWIYYVSGPEPQDEIEMDIWRVRSSGGSPERLTSHAAISFLTLLNSRTLLYLARSEDWSGPWLWALDVEQRMSRRISSGVDQFTSVAASRDGSRVVATVANPTSTLWSVPLLDRVAEDRDAERYQLPVPMGHAQAPRFGPAALFYLSAGGSGDGLWKVHEGQASEIWRNVDGALSEPPAVSPDGQHVAVAVRRQGKRLLSIMSPDGTNRQTVAPSIEVEGVAGQGIADWSPDSTEIVMGGRDSSGAGLFLIPIDGRPSKRLVDCACVNPVWSRDGKLIVYAGRSLIGQVKLLAVRRDGTPVELPDVWARPGGYRFLPNGTGIVYLPRIHAIDFWLFDLVTKRTRPLTHFSNQGTIRTFDITADGRSIVFDRSRQNSDIVLIDLPK